MRILIVIAHYFKQKPAGEWEHALGSGRDPIARIAALNAEIVALHRHFGPHRLSRDASIAAQDTLPPNTLDIVVLTMRDANVLDRIGLEPPIYSVEYFDGAPMMLAFEAQRVMRERAGDYDVYGYMEDDLIIVDPAFFEKTIWFIETFGPEAMLIPTRYEMAHSGTPAKIEFEPRLAREVRGRLHQPSMGARLTATWQGRQQTFRQPSNPHAGCYFLTAAQLERWLAHPSFYDRDDTWIDPLVSACTYAPGRVFGLYKSAEPDPWFHSIEHFGTR